MCFEPKESNKLFDGYKITLYRKSVNKGWCEWLILYTKQNINAELMRGDYYKKRYILQQRKMRMACELWRIKGILPVS